MEDEFFYGLREEPRPAFAAELWEKLQDTPPQPARRFRVPVTSRAALGVAAVLVLAVGAILASTPSARGAFPGLWREMAGVKVYETNIGPTEPIATPSGDTQLVAEPRKLAFEELRSLVPASMIRPPQSLGSYQATSPANLMVRADGEVDSLQVLYSDGRGGSVTFVGYAHPLYEIDSPIVGQDSTREVTVRGRPAVLVTGSWSGVGVIPQGAQQPEKVWSWSSDAPSALIWREGDQHYYMLASSQPGEELMQLAETIP